MNSDALAHAHFEQPKRRSLHPKALLKRLDRVVKKLDKTGNTIAILKYDLPELREKIRAIEEWKRGLR